jgi:hypothetical protein
MNGGKKEKKHKLPNINNKGLQPLYKLYGLTEEEIKIVEGEG